MTVKRTHNRNVEEDGPAKYELVEKNQNIHPDELAGSEPPKYIIDAARNAAGAVVRGH